MGTRGPSSIGTGWSERARPRTDPTAGTAGPTGKLTGYYVAELHASRTRHGKFQTPVLGRPDDLAMVDLSGYIKDAHGRRIWGRFDHGELVPYYTRAEIRKGALARRGLELMYVDDPVDLLFTQIEGSAKANLDDVAGFVEEREGAGDFVPVGMRRTRAGAGTTHAALRFPAASRRTCANPSRSATGRRRGAAAS